MERGKIIIQTAHREAPSYVEAARAIRLSGGRLKRNNKQINLVALRNSRPVFNEWSCYFGVIWYENKTPYYKVFPATTYPGHHYLVDKLLNKDGTAIIKTGIYKESYALGLHKKKTPAIVQKTPVQYYRDGNKNKVFDFEGKVYSGIIGVNIHGTTNKFPFVNKWSGGCIVLQDPIAMDWILGKCEESAEVYGNSFDLNLITF